MKSLTITLLLAFLIFEGCNKTNSSTPIMIDFDGNQYRTIRIGTQIWTIENLHVKHTPEGKTVVSHPPKEDTLTINVYGLLYDWNTARLVIPRGWHLPSDEEWIALEKNLNGIVLKDSIFESHQSKMQGREFCIRPAGYWNDAGFDNRFGNTAVFWTSTAKDSHFVWSRVLTANSDSLRKAAQHPQYGFSVRCVKDNK